MPRRRNYSTAKTQKIKYIGPIYQASDNEIQSDLRKMRYSKKAEQIVVIEKEVKVELPKKRTHHFEDSKNVIYGLVKLITTKELEIQKKQQEKVKKEIKVVESCQKTEPIFNNQAYTSFLALQNQYFRNALLMSQFSFMGDYNNNQFISSADKHLKAARFIFSDKKFNNQNYR
ncbi:hypothetical protein SteCoe_7200 [Stentor coeruleus]|uniref:Uncharacterized protein n=1 Tax=Stentor coeruleus TaxID=5963 RepID=A0A1R2CN06_9CILI|nr:hypothetical protein SteCoe_7200 [Stentor coeruleus]